MMPSPELSWLERGLDLPGLINPRLLNVTPLGLEIGDGLNPEVISSSIWPALCTVLPIPFYNLAAILSCVFLEGSTKHVSSVCPSVKSSFLELF